MPSEPHPSYPAILTIAGSDSGGGAGIQADLKTFAALQCYGASVVTALTAQNTKGVDDVHPTPPDFIEKQLDSVLSDISFKAIKTGMLYDVEHVRAVSKNLRTNFQIIEDSSNTKDVMPPIVVDPVCVSTSGHRLLREEAIAVMCEEIFPLATLITPNKSEAEVLASHYKPGIKDKTITDIRGAMDVAEELGLNSACDVLLKGGHLTLKASDLQAYRANNERPFQWVSNWSESNMEILRDPRPEAIDNELVVDVLYIAKSHTFFVFSRTRIDSSSTHGTGCTLSSAIASHLALGHTVVDAVKLASEFTYNGIQAAFPVGNGHGPLNHMHNSSLRLISPPSKEDPYPFTRSLIRSNATVWKQYVEHPFVKQLGAGTLPKENFLHFVKQDYHYLKYYARAYGLLIAKSRRFADIKPAVDTILNVLNEVSMHQSYCSTELGISEFELNSTPESPATTAYGAYLIDSGLHGDETKLIITLAACLLGYGEVGLWLKSEAQKHDSWVKWETNPYLKWMDDYSGVHYQNAVRSGLEILESAAREDPPSPKRLEEWIEVWGKCTMLEKQFWDMAMNLS